MEADNDQTQSFLALTKGTEVGHYKIIEKIGAGGMGEVYLAEDTELGRQVALKFLSPYLCQDEDCRKRFKREAQAAAKLSHPNIITIHEVSEYQGRPFFAMEHIEGESLKEYASGKDLTIEQILELGIQVCEGLNGAHAKGVIHRDIKPSNILIDSNGRVRIVDFGLASVVGSDQLTKTGSTLGTIGYMSPEQVQGKDVDFRSDLFSAGVVLYEMITGRRPFEGKSEAAILNSILNTNPEPLARYKSDIPDELQVLVSKLLEKDMKLRYQSAAGIISDLKRLASDRVPTERPKDWWNKYVVAAAVVVLLIMAGVWFYDKFIGKTLPPPETERKILAVLPFKNLGNAEDEYFADGITEEIMTRLSSIKDLGIISSTSSFAYKGSNKTLPQIANELGVDYILEGNIRWDKKGGIDRVRITPQLIDVEGDIHIWSDNYDQQITDIFSIQTMIANSIAEALNIQLQDSEKEEIQKRPTDNIDAYHYYLKAKEFLSNAFEPAEAVIPIGMLNKAIQLDSSFIAAHVALVELYGGFGFMSSRWYFEKFDSLKQKAEFHAKTVSKLAKNTADDFIAQGHYNYYVLNDLESAENSYIQALKLRPNDLEIMTVLGYLQARMGKIEKGLDNLKRACFLDPYSSRRMFNTAILLWMNRNYSESEEILDRALEFTSEHAPLYNVKMMNILAMNSDFDSVWTILENCRGTIIKDTLTLAAMIQNYLYEERRFHEAAKIKVSAESKWFENAEKYHLYQGKVFKKNGELDKAKVHFDSLYLLTKSKLEEYKDISTLYILNGLAQANIGNANEAVEIGEKGFALVSPEKDLPTYAEAAYYMAHLYVETERYDDAISLLEQQMEMPSFINLFVLKQEPEWDPLRDNPRFQALIKKYEKGHEI